MSTIYPGPAVPDLLGRDCDGIRDTAPEEDLAAIRQAALTELDRMDREERSLSDLSRDLIHGPREDRYGSPADNLKAIGQMWGAMLRLDAPIPSWRVALMMTALKTARAAHEPTDDSLIDGVGYLELARDLRPDTSMTWHDTGLVGNHRDKAVSNRRGSRG